MENNWESPRPVEKEFIHTSKKSEREAILEADCFFPKWRKERDLKSKGLLITKLEFKTTNLNGITEYKF